ncbi:tetratricopeptide repeat protein [Azospirillum sp. YIM B02556]|uniref:Tetratricopeptide repeat protein n=1 Tax=Azospirillum endophyticum TaxID=2800326 RepID=A0ABS1F3G7_9PROT|nr:tetratricopeptide repeat protein [Azospirillum endophyticum]MBK1837956.1 tetratricopeptide repeat protein [Azospirillum endophyticum]
MASIQEALRVAAGHHGAGRLREAEILYGRILDAAPGTHAAAHLLGMLLAQAGRLDEAVPRIVAAVHGRPDMAEYHRDLGKLHQALGHPAEAAACQRRAIVLRPDDPAVPALLAVATQMLGDTDAAIEALGRALTLDPRDGQSRGRLALLLELRGLHHLEQRRAEAAITDLSRLPVLEPPTAERLFQLGNAWSRAGRPGDALARYRQALALQPDHVGALFNLGILTRQAGGLDLAALEQAAALLGRAVALAPDFLDARENLAIVLFQSYREAESLAQIDGLLTLKARIAAQEGAALALPPLRARPAAPEGRIHDVVAFSLWGTAEIYRRGAVENARLVPSVYPGWTCRIYHDDSLPPDLLAELDALGVELVAMPSGSGPVTGLYWRFLASDDPTVRRFVCRDCDSRVGPRERAAVEAWIASGTPFHVMRDHPLHGELMLAGMWGGTAGLLPPLEPLIERFAAAEADRWQDQRFLRSHLWPLIAGACLVHDSHQPGHGLPFPGHPGDPAEHAVGRRVG